MGKIDPARRGCLVETVARPGRWRPHCLDLATVSGPGQHVPLRLPGVVPFGLDVRSFDEPREELVAPAPLLGTVVGRPAGRPSRLVVDDVMRDHLERGSARRPDVAAIGWPLDASTHRARRIETRKRQGRTTRVLIKPTRDTSNSHRGDVALAISSAHDSRRLLTAALLGPYRSVRRAWLGPAGGQTSQVVAIPVLGYVDDLIILPLAIAPVVRLIPPHVMAEHRSAAIAAEGRSAGRVAAAIVIGIWLLGAAWCVWLVFSLA